MLLNDGVTSAVIQRIEPLESARIWRDWFGSAEAKMRVIRNVPDTTKLTKSAVKKARIWCAARRGRPVTRAYGGHYFSPQQSLWFDALRKSLPADEPARMVCLAALVAAASDCAAAPGHTAQPFQPTRTAKQYLHSAWSRDVPGRVKSTLFDLGKKHALRQGTAIVGDAAEVVQTLRQGDLVFIDPPYSGVHYSRFYHVLETLAEGACGKVTGTGRYPCATRRPKSDFSIKSRSLQAIEELFLGISERGASAIVTFPAHECSNGLSGALVTKAAKKYFDVEKKVVSSKFSTLGGTSGESATGSERAARKHAKELILQLRPKSQ